MSAATTGRPARPAHNGASVSAATTGRQCWLDLRQAGPWRRAVSEEAVHLRFDALVADDPAALAESRPGMRFGSRVDVYLPRGTESKVLLGQKVIGGETVLAEIGKQGLIEGVSQ